MDNINYRAWEKEDKKMYYHVETLYDSMGAYTLSGEPLVNDLCFGEVVYSNEGRPKRNKYYEVMLYTGKKDKNKKKIWEGDVVICPIGTFPVTFDNAMFKTGDHPLGFWDGTDVEVIGNIYKTPELLEIKK